MGRAPHPAGTHPWQRADQRMAPGGRMWGEAPVRRRRNRRLGLRQVGPTDPDWTPPEPQPTTALGWRDNASSWTDSTKTWR